MAEIDNFLTRLNALETNYSQRFIAIDNKIAGGDAVFANLNLRLDAQGADINRLKNDLLKLHMDVALVAKALPELRAGLDTLLAQTKPPAVQVQPRFKMWRW